jgi:hypothetical protein
MHERIAPREQQAQEIGALVPGQSEAQSGEELLRALGRLWTERGLQEGLEDEPAEALGRARYARRSGRVGYGKGDEDGTRKTAAGVWRVPGPQIRGREEPYRAEVGSQGARTREVVKRLRVEM